MSLPIIKSVKLAMACSNVARERAEELAKVLRQQVSGEFFRMVLWELAASEARLHAELDVRDGSNVITRYLKAYREEFNLAQIQKDSPKVDSPVLVRSGAAVYRVGS